MANYRNVREVARFVLVGASNTAVDFIVLNILIFIFGLTQSDPHFVILKSISFSIAAFNSYIWNKNFVFKKGKRNRSEQGLQKTIEFWKFIAVSVVGLFINTAVSSVIFSLASVQFSNFSPHTIANLSALFGSAVVFTSNFLGYKFLVFKN